MSSRHAGRDHTRLTATDLDVARQKEPAPESLHLNTCFDGLLPAVLVDPSILVLDEATSSVDNETEAAIQRSLDRMARDRTTIVVAHRLSTIRHADRIYVLEEGRVAESGTHEELVAVTDGIYRALWDVQTGEAVGHQGADVRYPESDSHPPTTVKPK